jgi:outer membrane lipoprotein-sorting protein
MRIQLLNIYKKTVIPDLFLLLFLPFIVNAQPEGYSLVSNPGFESKKISDISASTNSINAEFIQEKNLSFIKEKIISKGILLYQRPDKLRLEYTEPFSYILIMNGGRMMTDNGDKKSEYDLKSNNMFGEINNLIIGSVKGNILGNPDFKSTIYENDENLFIHLMPLNNELSKYIKTIGLYISKNDYNVSELQITEQSDDYTLIRFTNKVINEDIPPASFNLQ